MYFYLIFLSTAQISYYKVPRYVLFVDEFPRTPTGKAQKFAMTEKSIKLLKLESE